MSLTRPTWATNTIQSLANQVTGQATAVKIAFDKPATDIKEYNETLCDEIEAMVEAQSPLNIANDSITDAKLKQDGDNILPRYNAHLTDNTAHGVGALSGLLTTIKTSIVNAINEIKSLFDTHKADSAYFAKSYGLIGDGTTSDSTALNALVTTIGSDKKAIYFSSGTYVISGNVTIPENIKLTFENGAMLDIGTGVTVTINGVVKAGLHQIFSTTGTVVGTPKVKEIPPQWFGAIGDYSHDDTTALRSAINLSMLAGVDAYLPSGIYLVTTTLVIDNSTSEYFLDRKKIGIYGDSLQTTKIVYTGTGECLSFIGGKTGVLNAHMTYQKIKDLTIVGTSTTTTYGISIDTCSFMHFQDVVVNSFDYGIYAVDTDNLSFTKVVIAYNKRGYFFRTANPLVPGISTCPNDINFYDCNTLGNTEYGLIASKGSCFNFYGGDVEGNGIGGVSSPKGGLLFYDGCAQGGVGCNINGVYFESNVGLGDVVIINENAMVAPFELNEGLYNITGCSFNRPSATDFCTHNIYVNFNSAISGQQKLVVKSCSFKNYSEYTPSAARGHIVFTADARTALNCYIKDLIQTADVEAITEDNYLSMSTATVGAIGEFKQIISSVGASLALPAGGFWEWSGYWVLNATGAMYYFGSSNAGVAAGGTTIMGAQASHIAVATIRRIS